MDETTFWIIVFVVSLAGLLKFSEMFIKSSEKIGHAFGFSPFVIGALILALGTSLPELISGIFAVINNSPEILVGNVVGSNITNIFFVLGIVALMSKKIEIDYDIIKIDLPLLAGSAFLLAFAIWDGVFSMIEAVLFLAGAILYIHYILTSRNVATILELDEEEIKKTTERSARQLSFKHYVLLVISGAGLYFSADYNIQSIIIVAEKFDIGGEFIALTVVALGTSLPELVVSIIASIRGNAEMAVGNILGSNIFNSFAVMAIPAFFGSITIPDSIITFSLPVMLMATIIYFFMVQDRTVSRWEGGMLLIFYVFFIVQLVTMI